VYFSAVSLTDRLLHDMYFKITNMVARDAIKCILYDSVPMSAVLTDGVVRMCYQ
jgi:hypothetical protein